VLNVTATGPTTGGYFTVTPSGVYNALASNLNFGAGETVPNLVVVPVGYANGVSIYNSNGETDIVVDMVGWFDIPAQRVALDGLVPFGSDVKIDSTSTYAYVSSQTHNRIEVLRLADGVLEDPILVGSLPMGLDFSPDGSLLYVANRGSSFVSVVDLGTRTEVRRYPIPSGFASDTPYSIAVLANGKALLTTTFWGYGFGSYMLEIDLATGVVVPRSDFFHEGRTTEYTSVRASGDRRSAVVVVGDLSSGPVFRYDTATNTFTEEVNTDTFTSAIATNLDGSVTLVNMGSFVYDEEMRLLGTVPGCGTLGVAVNAAGTVGYGLLWDHHVFRGFLAVCDLVRFEVTKRIPLGAVEQVGRMALSPDGTTLVGIIDTGLVLIRP
ncbi:MAG TPA: beta-propeller fold lactonase family protein, partial [Acidimicrobiales bacterium]|nr:beta-propeller fold lactonase family protein [Acidimicrobiales bacterium]